MHHSATTSITWMMVVHLSADIGVHGLLTVVMGHPANPSIMTSLAAHAILLPTCFAAGTMAEAHVRCGACCYSVSVHGCK